jgi:hypothetical protein
VKKQQNDKQNTTSAGPARKGEVERDQDDLVHSREEEQPSEIGEEDPDDMVHRTYTPTSNDTKEEDPDDLVHGQRTEDDQDL